MKKLLLIIRKLLNCKPLAVLLMAMLFMYVIDLSIDVGKSIQALRGPQNVQKDYSAESSGKSGVSPENSSEAATGAITEVTSGAQTEASAEAFTQVSSEDLDEPADSAALASGAYALISSAYALDAAACVDITSTLSYVSDGFESVPSWAEKLALSEDSLLQAAAELYNNAERQESAPENMQKSVPDEIEASASEEAQESTSSEIERSAEEKKQASVLKEAQESSSSEMERSAEEETDIDRLFDKYGITEATCTAIVLQAYRPSVLEARGKLDEARTLLTQLEADQDFTQITSLLKEYADHVSRLTLVLLDPAGSDTSLIDTVRTELTGIQKIVEALQEVL